MLREQGSLLIFWISSTWSKGRHCDSVSFQETVKLIAFFPRIFISQDGVLMADAFFTSFLAGMLITCL